VPADDLVRDSPSCTPETLANWQNAFRETATIT
jgi:hypothetical protein